MINLLEPFINKVEKKYVLDALRKKEISTYGKFSEQFEKKLSIINKSRFNLAVTSGSVALYLANKVCGANNESIVIAPSYTFIATINSIIHTGASPVLFDISPTSLCIDINQVQAFLKNKTIKKNNIFFSKQTKKKITAICVVLTFSIIPDLEKIKKICKKYKLKFIIDAACALGSFYNKKSLTKYADIVIYSLNGNKSITSGGGGVLSTDSKKIYKEAFLLANNGKIKNGYEYKLFGHNFRITNLHAALGIAQLKKFKEIKNKKKKIQSLYLKKIINKKTIFLPKKLDLKYNLWINFIVLSNSIAAKKIIKILKKNKINSNFFWKPIHLQSFTKKILVEDMKNTNNIWNRLVPLPSSADLNKKTQLKIIKIINSF